MQRRFSSDTVVITHCHACSVFPVAPPNLTLFANRANRVLQMDAIGIIRQISEIRSVGPQLRSHLSPFIFYFISLFFLLFFFSFLFFSFFSLPRLRSQFRYWKEGRTFMNWRLVLAVNRKWMCFVAFCGHLCAPFSVVAIH